VRTGTVWSGVATHEPGGARLRRALIFRPLQIRARRSLAPPFVVPMRAKNGVGAFHEPPHPVLLRPVGEKVPDSSAVALAKAEGRLRGIPAGSWLRFTSGFWRCSLSVKVLVACAISLAGTPRCGDATFGLRPRRAANKRFKSPSNSSTKRWRKERNAPTLAGVAAEVTSEAETGCLSSRRWARRAVTTGGARMRDLDGGAQKVCWQAGTGCLALPHAGGG